MRAALAQAVPPDKIGNVFLLLKASASIMTQYQVRAIRSRNCMIIMESNHPLLYSVVKRWQCNELPFIYINRTRNKYTNWAIVFLFQITGAIYAIYGLLNRISRLVNPLVVNSVFSETVESSVRGTTFLMDAAFSFLALGFALYVPFEFLHFIHLCKLSKLPKNLPSYNTHTYL